MRIWGDEYGFFQSPAVKNTGETGRLRVSFFCIGRYMSISVDNEKEPAYNSLHNFVLITDYKIIFNLSQNIF